MSSHVVVDSINTWLRPSGDRPGEQAPQLTCDNVPPLSVGDAPCVCGRTGQWSPESLLAGAVEVGTYLTFLELAKARGVEVLSYSSSTTARVAREQSGGAHFTDLIVSPRVTVRSAADAQLAAQLFAEIPNRCIVARAVRPLLRIDPTLEAAEPAHVPAKGSAPGKAMRQL